MNQVKRICRSVSLTAALGAFALVMCFAGPAARGQATGIDGTRDSREAPRAKAIPQAPSKRHRIGFAPRKVRLEAINLDEVRKEDDLRAKVDKVRRYGVGRAVDVREQAGQWIEIPGQGRMWTVDLSSAGAIGIRLHFAGLNMPDGAELFVYGLDDPARLAGPYAGRGVHGSAEMWTPTRFGETVRVEYFVPAGGRVPAPAAFPFTIDRIQHIYHDVLAGRGEAEGGGAGPCHNDITCFPIWANGVGDAVGGIGFINSDALYCTGQLMNSQNTDFTPYWLTANHCLSTQAAAQSAEIYWDYETNVCGGAPPALSSVPQSAVTTLLSTGAASDYTLLMVEGTLPGGLLWAGWDSGGIANGTNCTCIHHPSGDFKRISFATKSSTLECGGADHIRANWYDGPTEPGSSGSGLFLDANGRLIGQLHCGPSACGNETYDQYGAFSSTYPNISSLLSGGSDDGLEDNDTCSAAVAVAGSSYPNLIVKGVDQDWYRMTIPGGNTLTVTTSFTHAFGDIDIRLHNGCGGSVVASSTSVTNNENISYTNNGGTADFFLNVYLFSDQRNRYSMTISGAGSCGSPAAGDCCQINGSAGCNDENCCNAVCATDPFCCNNNWDDQCATEAADLCTSCGADACGSAGAGPCCEDNGTIGCDNADCCAAVCVSDPFCCDSNWDGKCAAGAADLCPACGAVPCGSAGAGDCCADNDTPGCTSPECCEAVCADDAYCCDTEWDQICADAAAELCLTCGAGKCGAVDAGDCCVINGTQGCDDAECCDLICATDPFCCTGNWDGQCATEAADLCQACAPPPPNDTCGTAINASAGGDFPGDLTAATSNGAASCGNSAGNPDAWYAFTATCDGTLRAQTCGTHDAPGLDEGMDTVLSVHSACPGTAGNQLQCNDDWPLSADPTACVANDDGASRDSAISLDMTAGQIVLIRVSHFGAALRDGAFVLRVTFDSDPPANDNCPAGTNVSAGGTFAGTLCGATNDGAGDCGLSATNPDAWYTFTAACDTTMRVSTCGTHDADGPDSGVDTVLSIHTGCPGGVGNLVECNDDWPFGSDPTACTDSDGGARRDSAAAIPMSAGQTARIRVSKFNTTPVGPFVLNVSSDECPPVCGVPGAGDCCEENMTPGCDDEECCLAVCACDPYCCDTEWDGFCAGDGVEGNGCGAAVLCGDICGGPPPFIVHANGMPGETTPCSGYIDPRAESTNGVDVNLGLDKVALRFSEPVFALGGAIVDPSSFVVTQTGPLAPPTVTAVDATANPLIVMTFNRRISLYEWTTVRAIVENAAGIQIENLGDLGSANEPDRLDVAYLPCDVDQDQACGPFDLLRFRQYANGLSSPDCGPLEHYVDINRSGAMDPFDLLRFRQMVNGISPATRVWNGELLNSARP